MLGISTYIADDESPEWYAIDRHGFVGAFNSEGGYIPKGIVLGDEYFDAMKLLYDNFGWESSYCMEHEASRFRRGLYERFPNPEEMESFGLRVVEQHFSILAKKGIFTFNPVYHPGKGSNAEYFCVCRPTKPVMISDIAVINAEIAKLILRVDFKWADFSSCRVIDVLRCFQTQ